MILAKIKWIFFDIGSTLVDESVAYQNRIERTIAGTNVTYDDFYNKMVEISKYNQSGYNKALEAYDLKTVPWNSDDEFVYPETENCLSELSKHYKIGIIANQNLGSEERLEKLGLLKHIDLVIASAEEGVAKPDLRIFQIALARADNKIGMTTVWIKQGFGRYAELKEIEEHPDYTINNLNDLLNLLE